MTSLYEMHAEICRMFSNPKRLEIIDHLRGGELTVGKLAGLTGLTQPALSQHLTLMWHNGVLARRKEGANVYYSLPDPKIAEAFDIFRQILMERLESTERLVEEMRGAST